MHCHLQRDLAGEIAAGEEAVGRSVHKGRSRGSLHRGCMYHVYVVVEQQQQEGKGGQGEGGSAATGLSLVRLARILATAAAAASPPTHFFSCQDAGAVGGGRARPVGGPARLSRTLSFLSLCLPPSGASSFLLSFWWPCFGLLASDSALIANEVS